MSLGIDIKMAMSTTFIGSLLSNFPLLRELATTTIDPASFAFIKENILLDWMLPLFATSLMRDI
jgi:hypothetical protein